MPPARAVELLGKRATGYVNWWRRRAHLHVPEALAGIVADIQPAEARPHRADRRPGEHLAAHRVHPRRRMAAAARRAAGRHRHSRQPRRLCRHRLAAEPRPVGRLHRGRRPAAGDRLQRLPDAAPARAAWRWSACRAGCPSRRSSPPARLGEAQIAKAEKLLADLGREGLCRVVLIHHPPLTTESRFKRLTDAAAFQAMVAPRRLRARPARPQSPQRSGAHRRPGRADPRDRRHLGLGGAGQQVRPRALAPHSHRA